MPSVIFTGLVVLVQNILMLLLCSSIGEGASWSKKIYPGMKKALIHVLLVTQDEMDDKKVNHMLE